MEEIQVGTVDRTILVFIPDPASTTGAGKTGVAHGSITVSAARVEDDNDVIITDFTSSLNALSALTDAHNDWGWREVSSTLFPGLYRLDVADSLFASGRWYTALNVTLTSGLAPIAPRLFKIVAHDPADLGTKQSGDSFARLGAPAGASVSADLAVIDDFLDTEIAAIKAKTDNLPSDPADASDIAGSFTTVNTKLDTIDDFLDTEIAAIKAKTDNLPADPADASDIAGSFTTVNTKLDTIDDFLDTEVAAIKAKTDNLPADPADASDIATLIDAIPTAAENAAGLLDLAAGVETGLTLRQALRLIAAAAAGKLSGAATTTIVIRNAVADSKDRITATVDADGNRSAITVDLT
jgi:hypothetical protein